MFEIVIAWPTEPVPTPWLENVRLLGFTPPMAPSPVPDKDTVWGDPEALSVIVSVPVLFPTAVGVNVTFIVHVPLTTTLEQLFVWEKSPLLETEEMVRVPVPELVTVTGWELLEVLTFWPAKVIEFVLSDTAGVGTKAVPDRGTVCGDPVALSDIDTEAVLVPAAVGEKVTEIVQLAFAAKVLPQVVVLL